MTVQISRNAVNEMREVSVAQGAHVLVAQVVGGDGMPDTMGVGFTRYDGMWDYRLNYDVTYYVLEGTLTIHWKGDAFTADPGDVVFMSRGIDIRYDATHGGCVLFWAAFPGNWEEISNLGQLT
jgi:ethanolamine utilization protein EutQ (cupin superfamily)